MNDQNLNQIDNPKPQKPEQDKYETPSLFCSIFCFIVSIVCFAFAAICVIANIRMATYNAAYGIPSSTGQFAFDIGVWIGKVLPIVLGIAFGLMFFVPAVRSYNDYKKWKKENKK